MNIALWFAFYSCSLLKLINIHREGGDLERETPSNCIHQVIPSIMILTRKFKLYYFLRMLVYKQIIFERYIVIFCVLISILFDINFMKNICKYKLLTRSLYSILLYSILLYSILWLILKCLSLRLVRTFIICDRCNRKILECFELIRIFEVG